MKDIEKIFITGTARGGSGLICRMLNVNKSIEISIAPYLEIFRLIRNLILQKINNKNYPISKIKSEIFKDYFYSEKDLKLMDKTINSLITGKLKKNIWNEYLPQIKKRTSIQNKELLKNIGFIYNKNQKKIIENCFQSIVLSRNLKTPKLIGIKEAWIIELFLPLAKLFKKAKFIVIIRDPRSSYASNLNIKDKRLIAHPFSFLRNWRKNICFAAYYKCLKIFKNRIYVLRYEDFVLKPEKNCKKLCKFLNIKFEKKMINPNNFYEFGSLKPWKGNSSFKTRIKGIDKSIINIWKKKLTKDQIQTIEIICASELEVLKYKIRNKKINNFKFSNLIENFTKELKIKRLWRSDIGQLEIDAGVEIFRYIHRNKIKDIQTIRRLFLFEKTYRVFQKKEKIIDSI